MLEEEVYSHNSPIWSEEFLEGTSGSQMSMHTGKLASHLTPNNGSIASAVATLCLFQEARGIGPPEWHARCQSMI